MDCDDATQAYSNAMDHFSDTAGSYVDTDETSFGEVVDAAIDAYAASEVVDVSCDCDADGGE